MLTAPSSPGALIHRHDGRRWNTTALDPSLVSCLGKHYMRFPGPPTQARLKKLNAALTAIVGSSDSPKCRCRSSSASQATLDCPSFQLFGSVHSPPLPHLPFSPFTPLGLWPLPRVEVVCLPWPGPKAASCQAEARLLSEPRGPPSRLSPRGCGAALVLACSWRAQEKAVLPPRANN